MTATFEQLYGTGAIFNTDTLTLEIPLTALAQSGLDAIEPTALETLAAIAKNAHAWLSTNTDETVAADSEVRAFAPTFRNNEDKTQHQYSLNFYTPYTAPTFDPDEVQ